MNKYKVWKDYIPLVKELVKRDLKVKYRRSFLGYLWSLLNPLMMMLVMSAVFSSIFRYDIENFPLYLIAGQTIWTFFSESTDMAMFSVIQNAPLLKKVYIPKFIFPLSRVISSFVTMMFSFVAILLVMLITKATFTPYILLFPIPIFLLLLFCAGVSMMLSALAVYFRDVTHLYGVLRLAWMYLTPIFYPMEALDITMQNVVKCNPIYYYMTYFREIMIYGVMPDIQSLLICVSWSIGALVVGIFVFNKLSKNFVSYI